MSSKDKLNNTFYHEGSKIRWRPKTSSGIFITRSYKTTPPIITDDMKKAMNYNRWLNLHRYEDPFDYIFEDSDE